MNRREMMGAIVLAAWQASHLPRGRAPLPSELRMPKFQLRYECDATLPDFIDFGATTEGQHRIIPMNLEARARTRRQAASRREIQGGPPIPSP